MSAILKRQFLIVIFPFCTMLQQHPPKGLDLNQAVKQGAVLDLVIRKGYTDKEFVKIDNTWYINPEGTFYLFEVNEETNQYNRLDKSIHHGATYGRFLFSHNNCIYSFGGRGMFTHHSNLLKFNFENSEWDQFHVDGLNNKDEIAYATIKGDSLIFLTRDQENYSLSLINLKTKSFRPLQKYSNRADQFFIPKKIIRGNNFDYLQSEAWEYGIVFDKSKLEFFETDFIIHEFSDSISASIFIGDSIISTQRKFDPSSELVFEIDFSKFKKIKLENNFSMHVGVISFLLIIISLLLYFYQKNRKTRNNNLPKEVLNTYLYAHELDDILGVEHSNYDSRRTLRSRIIKEINLKGVYQIDRSRDVNDKRIMLYTITLKK